jgi:hypothetical protein
VFSLGLFFYGNTPSFVLVVAAVSWLLSNPSNLSLMMNSSHATSLFVVFHLVAALLLGCFQQFFVFEADQEQLCFFTMLQCYQWSFHMSAIIVYQIQFRWRKKVLA